MNWIVDRVEGDFAVVIFEGQAFDVPVAALPPGVTEGWRLSVGAEGPADTTAAAERMARLAAQHAVPDSFDL